MSDLDARLTRLGPSDEVRGSEHLLSCLRKSARLSRDVWFGLGWTRWFNTCPLCVCVCVFALHPWHNLTQLHTQPRWIWNISCRLTSAAGLRDCGVEPLRKNLELPSFWFSFYADVLTRFERTSTFTPRCKCNLCTESTERRRSCGVSAAHTSPGTIIYSHCTPKYEWMRHRFNLIPLSGHW